MTIVNKKDVHSRYLLPIFMPDRLKEVIDLTIPVVQQAMKDCNADALAFQGASGSAVAYILSFVLGVPLVYIRKDADNSHHAEECGRVEGWVETKRYIIIDDFIDSGNSLKRIVSILKDKIPDAKCVGVILFLKKRFATPDNKTIRGYGVHKITVPIYGCQEKEYLEGEISISNIISNF